jgi:hypothetical protein
MVPVPGGVPPDACEGECEERTGILETKIALHTDTFTGSL